MDWALLTQTVERLDTLEGMDFLHELSEIEETDPDLAARVKNLRSNRWNASSFMQTRMPGAQEPRTTMFGAGDKIGVWEIAECLGAGGMGEVYRATRADKLFDQQVALKIAKIKTKSFRNRFESERQRLAQLEHPNIARIIDGGTADNGGPYLTMEFVDGMPIDAFVKANQLGREARLGLIGELCVALSHAHGRLVLHRDIKPDNVLVNTDGMARLIDFGVASLLDEPVREDEPGPLTLRFAAPEQLLGQPVSAATDVFAVGMLAHLLEIGALPKRLPDGGVLVDVKALADEDLSAILGKATAFDPSDRYASADALGDDLRRFVEGFPVAARPLSPLRRLRKLVARNTLASAMSAAAIAAVVAGVIGVSVFAVRADDEAKSARFAEQQGARTIEFYETINGGYTRFTSSIDPTSALAEEYSKALLELEAKADANAQTDYQGTLQTYVFLAEFYADQGRDRDASRLGEKLSNHVTELTYASAFTLFGLVHLSRGFVEDQKLVERLDMLYEFFSADRVAHSFDLAINRCVRSEFTADKSDAQQCVDLAKDHIAKVDMQNYSEASGVLPLLAYGVDGALALKEFDQATAFAKSGLQFYENESRPGSVPEPSFWMNLSDIAQAQEDWPASIENLTKANALIEGDQRFPWLEVSLMLEMAQSNLAIKDFKNLEASARKALNQAEQLYGSDHHHVRDARSYLAMVQADNGQRSEATSMLQQIIAEEEARNGNAEAVRRYNDMLATIAQM
ncbi:MAG: serine/threonine-protein kinase [Pseudomonadota bacterium]